jgi:hypothetical protein
MIVEYEHRDDSAEKLRLTKEHIEAETNIATLLRWSEALDATVGDISSQIEAHVLSGVDDDDWLIPARDALGFCKMGLRRVGKRLEKLGHGGEDRDRLTRLQDANASLKAALVKCRRDTAFAAAAKDVLSNELYGAVSKRADELMTPAQDLALAA